MTGAEQAKYQRIPTDESEAQTLASADLDGIKSESNAGFRFRLLIDGRSIVWIFFFRSLLLVADDKCWRQHPSDLSQFTVCGFNVTAVTSTELEAPFFEEAMIALLIRKMKQKFR